MKKHEITPNDLDQLFDRMIGQKPLLSEDQVISLLEQLPVTSPQRTMKSFFRNHLNTWIVGMLVVGLAVMLLWVETKPGGRATVVQDQPLPSPQLEPVLTDTLPVQPGSTAVAKEDIRETVPVDQSIKTSPVLKAEEPITVEKIDSVADIYRHFEKQSQLFTIETARDTTIICQEGTLIRIKANTLVSEKTGQAITGKVQLEVREYYKVPDMLLSRLTTTSGKEMLETGGMLYLDARANQEKCKIQEGREIEIGFPYMEKKQEMALFNGEKKNDLIDWKPAPVVTNIAIMTGTVVGTDEETPYTILEQMPEFPGGEAALIKQMEQWVRYPYSALKDKIQGKVFVNFIVEKDGSVTNIRVRRGLDPMLDKVAVNIVSNMPKWIPGKQNGEAVRASYTIPVNFTLKEGALTSEEILQSKALDEKIKAVKVDYLDSKYLTKEEFKEDFERKALKDNLQNTRAEDANRYVFSVTQLGWINCDRFIRNSGQRVNYSIRIDQPGDVIATVILHRYKSIMPGTAEVNRITFMNVPLGEKITIVAFKTVNNQIYLAVKDAVITNKEETDLDFQPVTMELLKKEMEKLGRFN